MLTVPSKYALKALITLSREDPDEFIQVKALSKKAKVPGAFLAKIVKLLAKKGILETRKGARGGARFARRREPFSFYEVCKALNDPSVTQACFMSRAPCNAKAPCPMHKYWSALQQDLIESLHKTKIT